MGKKRPADPREEAARKDMFARGNAFATRYLPCVRPIILKDANERASLIGSAVLLTLAGRCFALTAGHVADCSADGTLMIGGMKDVWMLPPLYTSTAPGPRATDPLDVAFAELDAGTVAGLGEVAFLELHDLEVNHQVIDDAAYTVIGYPAAAQGFDTGRGHFEPVATVFSNVPLPEGQYRRLERGLFTPATNVALCFDPSRVMAPEGIKALKHQHGLSGGGVWRFGRRAGAAASDRLVGILIYVQARGGTRALVATRMDHFVAAILHTFPNLAPTARPSDESQ